MSNIIRIRMSINLPENQPIPADLNALKPVIERAVAGALPDMRVDTVKVTRINEAKAQVIHPDLD